MPIFIGIKALGFKINLFNSRILLKTLAYCYGVLCILRHKFYVNFYVKIIPHYDVTFWSQLKTLEFFSF